jgi:hypothetical protein
VYEKVLVAKPGESAPALMVRVLRVAFAAIALADDNTRTNPMKQASRNFFMMQNF